MRRPRSGLRPRQPSAGGQWRSAGTISPQGLIVSGLTPSGAPPADRRSRIRGGSWVSGSRFIHRETRASVVDNRYESFGL